MSGPPLGIPGNLVKLVLNSDLCLFDQFRPKINMGDREVVVIMQLSICIAHHTQYITHNLSE